MKLRISKRALIIPGLCTYMCGMYLGNTAKIISFIALVILTLPSIKLSKENQYAKHQLLFWAFLCLSFLWTHKELLNRTIMTLEILNAGATLYMSVLLYSYVNNKEDLLRLIHVLFISLIFLSVYLIIKTPVNYWGTYYIGQNIGINKNDIGMNFAWGSIFCFYCIRERIGNRINLFLFVLFVSLSLIAGSRKGVMILALGIIMYLVLCEKNIKALRNIGIAIVFLIIGYLFIVNVPVLNNLLGDRLQTMIKNWNSSSTISILEDKSIWERSYYRTYAWNMFLENPFSILFGHGLDAFRTRMAEIGYNHVAYSHCNYVELLANMGVIGFAAYYVFKFRLAISAFLQRDKDHISIMCMIVLLIGLFMEYGMVSYYSETIQYCYILAYLGIVIIPNKKGKKLRISGN